MISWLRRLLGKTTRKEHDQTVHNYRSFALAVGYALSDRGYDEYALRVRGKQIIIHDPEVYHILDELEEAYSSLGYRIIPLQDWIDCGGWGVSIDTLWLVKREKDERPQFTKFEYKTELPVIEN